VEDGEEEEEEGRLRFDQLGLRASQLKLPYYRHSVAGDEERSPGCSPPDTPTTRSVSSESSSDSGSAGSPSSDADTSSVTVQRKTSGGGGGKGVGLVSGGYLGSDALQKLKLHYHVNKAIAKGAELLFLTVTRKASLLSEMCGSDSRESYGEVVQQMVVAAVRLSQEVGMLEEDVLVDQSRRKRERDSEKSRADIEAAVRTTWLACHMASGPTAPSSAASKLMTAGNTLKETCSRTVASALRTAGQHRRALEQAQRMEQEFVSLMTGQRSVDGSLAADSDDCGEEETEGEESTRMRRYSSSAKLTADVNPTGVLFAEKPASPSVRTRRGSQSSWSLAKEAPVVSGATAQQLVTWLTYHRAIDAEFADTFLLTFSSFMTSEQLLTSLISRFSVTPPHQLSKREREAFLTDILIPIRLRVVHGLQVWIAGSYDDFKEGNSTRLLLNKFLNTVESFLPACSQQLRRTLATNVKSGPSHLHASPTGKPPSSLIPPDLASSHASSHTSFDLLDVNSLELARQLTLTFSYILRQIRPCELLSLGWREEGTAGLCPNISLFQFMSRKMSGLVGREVVRETVDEDRASVISYFVETAKSCRELKNFAGVSAIMDGLSQTSVQEQESAWQLVTEHLLRIYRELQGLVSPDDSHHRYRQDVRVIHQSPVVPDLGILLSDMEEIDETHADFLPEPQQDVVNFSKRRLQAKLVRQLQRHQSLPYNLTPVEIMQKYIRDLLEHSSEGHR
jgi:hypothetical protein